MYNTQSGQTQRRIHGSYEGSMDPMRSDVYILYVGHLCVVYI